MIDGEVAKKEREESGVSIEDQFKFKNNYDAFNKWREFIESKNILVFQFEFPLTETNGFCLINQLPYAIVVNSYNNILEKIFILLHEYAHILLGISEIYLEDFNSTMQDLLEILSIKLEILDKLKKIIEREKWN